MQYLGGKSRIAKHLAAKIHELVPDADLFWDPFCGGLSMSVALSKYGRVVSSDACAPLIALYRAVRAGWDPPAHVTLETYRAAKELPDSDPMKAFCGFGCSFGGKWFGGYAVGKRPDHVNGYAHGARRSLLEKIGASITFACVDWLAVKPQPIAATLYLDPPYAGTTGYGAIGAFDFDAFVTRAIAWSKSAHVFVSEYAFPVGQCVWESRCDTKINGGLAGAYAAATERLYYLPKGFAR